MAFQGDLSNINLASVFQNLLQNEQTGTLRLYDGDRERFVYFDEGKIAMFSAGRDGRTPLAEFLLRRGDVTPGLIKSAKKKLRGRRNLTQVLTKMAVEKTDIAAAAKSYVEEEVCDLFTWEAGRFEFTEGEPIKGVFDTDIQDARLKLVPDALILEAARRADEWDRIGRQIRSSGEIFVLRKERAADVAENYESSTVEVSRLLDGRRDVATLIDDSGMGRFAVSKAISELIEANAIRTVSLTEVMGQADDALHHAEWETAIRCYRRALEMERNNLDCRRGLAEALEGIGQKSDALGERKLLSNTLIDLGRKEEAAEELRKAIEDMPTDITARERYVSLLEETGSTRVAEAASIELGRTYLDLGIAEKAREIFSSILEKKPREPAIVAKMLAGACIKAGDVPGAVDAYSKAGEHYLKTEELDEAAIAYEEILKVQPGNSEAKKHLDEITSGRLLRRKRRMKLVKWFFLGAAAVVLGVGWICYDWQGRKRLDQCGTEALDCVIAGDLEKAIQCYRKVRNEYPFTYASISASRMGSHLSEALAKSLIVEGEKLEKRGLTAKAIEKYKRAEQLDALFETREKARKAVERLKGGGEPGPG